MSSFCPEHSEPVRSGDDVKFLQERLNARPPTALPLLAVDGKFGAKTRARVQEYQGNHALTVDGIVGPLTWGSLLGHAVAKTTGFCVLGRDLYDRRGVKVILRGVNKMSVFEQPDDSRGQISFGEIKQTGANTVRIVWAIATDQGVTSTATLDALITNAKAVHLIPMIELHDATGDWGRLNELVTYWTQPAVVSIIRKHQAYLLVNIGNEVGNDTVSQADFVAGYTDAVQRMRAAGIHTPLVIDAPDWGKDLGMLNNTAATLLAADPDGNLDILRAFVLVHVLRRRRGVHPVQLAAGRGSRLSPHRRRVLAVRRFPVQRSGREHLQPGGGDRHPYDPGRVSRVAVGLVRLGMGAGQRLQ